MSAKQLKLKDDGYTSNEELITLYQKNRDLHIRNKIIINNIGLIYSVAKKKIRAYSCFTIEDLVQEGIIGMMKSIEKFDLTKNTSFSTYSYYWITQQMDRALMNNGYIIRLPAYVYEKVNTISRLEDNYLTRNEEIDTTMICNEANITRQEYILINLYKKNYSSLTSLNSLMNIDTDENYVELQDYIPCPNCCIEDVIISEDLKEQIINILNTLTPKEKEVLKLRFGLNGGDPLTLETIGNKYNLTRERIRQIENKALKKIKRLNLKNGLKDYLLEC
ncbi:sigma-70 family RNA polymerase sigma factor [Schnuerera sp. xch1]|uniref:sigma-70 family RNA polymerase sigma factor n=1 Tax=Schnuerera sp. xch1 TaxID=2874283 RepID=UPI001CC1BC46|nr:sigma-70 family RNA polymerase sigma factor [Schnuerera sp. xch1]MBZ2175862.1 sigma-70 family RNA polymerase sigma factor [Schnuerera sp. xch1]